MYTSFLIAIIIMMSGCIISEMTMKSVHLYLGLGIGCLIVIALFLNQVIVNQTNKPIEVATPSKYTSQTYYIDNNNNLYIEKDGTTKRFGGDISEKLEFKDSVIKPSIEFKTIKKIEDPDKWIPFKYDTSIKTSISKVVLPKSALTEKLTKVEVNK